jgi:TolB-like protein
MAGLLAEDVGDFTTAREYYEVFLTGSGSGALRDEVEARLRVVRTEELRADVRQALARESELAQTTPDPSAVGIFPFMYEGGDPQWEPLGTALAELLITDLGITGRLRVLERVHVQALLDEMALARAGLVEAATAARSGRLLGSGLVVHGRYRVDANSRIEIDAAVVQVGPPGSEQVEPVRGEDALERLFDLEKQLALDLHAEMGVQLTPAEEAAINERHTESVQALLAFGRGLAASDAGDSQAAEAQFAEAASIDPSFALAQQKQQLAAAVSAATGVQATRRLSAQASRLARQRAAVRALRNAPASVRQRMLAKLGQRQRAVLAEVLGQDRVGTAILLELVFRRPGGEQ